MNSNAQHEFHPDAESLNAFAEQALGERERGQIMAHLAVCSRCRQVVFLAQEAGVELEPAVAASSVRSAASRQPWFWSWRFAWAPAAALAAIVALAFFVHVRRAETGSEMAKVAPQVAPRHEEAGSPAAPPQGTQAGPRPQEEATVSTQPTRQKRKATAQRSVNSTQLSLSAPPAAPSAEAGELASAGSVGPVAPPSASGAGYQALGAAAEFKPEPTAGAAWQKQQERAAAAAEMRSLAAKKMEQASANKASRRDETDRILTAAAPAAQFDAGSAPTASLEAGGGHAAGRAFAVYQAMAAGLPSGLPAVSTVTVKQSVLAVDRVGTVFLSKDSGAHWESIARQWNGRAVAVRTPRTAKAGELGTAGGPETVYELVNDQGQVWVSTDGRIWKAK
jgi:Putative zinc-finger